MKPTSIIFLTLSVIMLISGLMICNIASSKAADQGYELFIQKKDDEGNTVITYEMDSAEVTDLDLTITGADVNIIGGADASRVELINYGINDYSYNVAKSKMQISDVTNILTLLNLSGNGSQFKGFRYYRDLSNLKSGQKSVNIYLSADYPLETFSLNVNEGNIFVTGTSVACAYKLTTSTGNITMNSVKNAVSATVTVSEKGNVQISGGGITTITGSVNIGNFQYDSSASTNQSYALKTEKGQVTFNAQNEGTSYNLSTPAATTTCNVNVTEGNIIIVDMH